MISIGQKVRIKANGADEFFPAKLRRLCGVVVRRETGTGRMPVGESPTDPLYLVKTRLGTDAFWGEELEVRR